MNLQKKKGMVISPTITEKLSHSQVSLNKEAYFTIHMSNSKLPYLEVLCCDVHHEQSGKQHTHGWAH